MPPQTYVFLAFCPNHPNPRTIFSLMETQQPRIQDPSSRAPETPAPPSPPQPPPLPLFTHRSDQKRASIALKVRSAPPGWAFEGHILQPARDPFTPPAGTYFFYGTLQDPTILGEILDLSSIPPLRPAYLIGYEVKLWGQYPALVDRAGAVVEGSAFEVLDEASAEKLANYETQNYHPEPCIIRFRDSNKQKGGFTFKFCGNRNDLTEGSFDLGVWLKHMRRK